MSPKWEVGPSRHGTGQPTMNQSVHQKTAGYNLSKKHPRDNLTPTRKKILAYQTQLSTREATWRERQVEIANLTQSTEDLKEIVHDAKKLSLEISGEVQDWRTREQYLLEMIQENEVAMNRNQSALGGTEDEQSVSIPEELPEREMKRDLAI